VAILEPNFRKIDELNLPNHFVVQTLDILEAKSVNVGQVEYRDLNLYQAYTVSQITAHVYARTLQNLLDKDELQDACFSARSWRNGEAHIITFTNTTAEDVLDNLINARGRRPFYFPPTHPDTGVELEDITFKPLSRINERRLIDFISFSYISRGFSVRWREF